MFDTMDFFRVKVYNPERDASVAQRQSSGFVNRRSSVQVRPLAISLQEGRK